MGMFVWVYTWEYFAYFQEGHIEKLTEMRRFTDQSEYLMIYHS